MPRRPSPLVVLAGSLCLGACGDVGSSDANPPLDAVSARPGIELPYIVDPACPGEGCSYGTWLACDSIPLYAAPGDSSPTGQYLLRDEPFEVGSGLVIVDVPEVVVVSRPTRQLPYAADALTFAAGDTLYVLNYLGEGFFNAWYEESMLEVEAFWPWGEFYSDEDAEYGGEVVQPGSSSFWVRATDTDPEAWVWVDSASVAAPNALDPDPPVCR